ncbi:hypothetical protein KP509_17G047700 [Ceratopteris richardii]|uniref:Cyanovirin-N domain-containing protein n=1 Tax=Ceratopteris richardii TaxID=49495 RepID=A0A8T2SVZ0_CERRI|nr:hypothetical protein KP509_17G047700 [Ceratopteris richardii]
MALLSRRLLLLAGILVLLVPSTAAEYCNFTDTCTEVELFYGDNLFAACKGPQGDYLQTYISLNSLVGNDVGKLTCPGKAFYPSCDDLSLVDGHILKAKCLGEDWTFYDSSIDLNNCLKNSDGSLNSCNSDLSKATA